MLFSFTALAVVAQVFLSLAAIPVANAEIAEFPLTDIHLTNGSAFMLATQLNLEYLLMLDPDRLLYTFRVNANLSTMGAKPLGGWEAPTIEVRGHFVGHYMSATAMMWASTGNGTVSLCPNEVYFF